jgi:hypothetical protein
MEWAILPVLISLLLLYPFYAPMPKWRERQLERKKPMRGRIIDI